MLAWWGCVFLVNSSFLYSVLPKDRLKDQGIQNMSQENSYLKALKKFWEITDPTELKFNRVDTLYNEYKHFVAKLPKSIIQFKSDYYEFAFNKKPYWNYSNKVK